MKIDKNFIVNFPTGHPACWWLILVILEYLVTELLSQFLNFPYRIYLFLADSSIIKATDITALENVSIVNINIGFRIIALVFIGIATALYIRRKLYKKRVNDLESKLSSIQQDNAKLRNQLEEEQGKIETLIKEEAPYKEIRNMVAVLSDFTEKSEVVDSIQLFQYTPLPNPKQLSPDQIVEVGFKFRDGTASSKANVNALYNISYQLPSNVYIPFIELLEKRQAYFAERKRVRNTRTEKDIQSEAIALFGEISSILNGIEDASEISDQHYVLYRILEILATLVIAKEKQVSCQQLLNYREGVESQLKIGMRTGLLGSLLLQTMYCFANENSTYKRGRSYFATPLEYNSHKLMLLVMLQRDKLRIDYNDDELSYCTKVYDEIENLLLNSL